MKNYELPEEKKGNVAAAIIVGLIAAVVVAVLLAALTIIREKQTGAMVMLAGAGVGFAVKLFAAKDSFKFGGIAAVLAIISCMLGTAFCIIALFANGTEMSYMEVVSKFGIGGIVKLASLDFGFMDILFYGIAAYIGFSIGCNSSEKKDEEAENNGTDDKTPKEI